MSDVSITDKATAEMNSKKKLEIFDTYIGPFWGNFHPWTYYCSFWAKKNRELIIKEELFEKSSKTALHK